MNIRKNIDYSAMFAALDAALTAEMPQMQLCCELGRIVCSRPEKGAAVAAAEHLHSRFPDASGFSPRNLRRMREFYRMYEDTPELLTLAMEISVLVRPCKLLSSLSSLGLVTTISLFSTAMFILLWKVLVRVPFGPFTVTVLPSRVTSTPAGITTGFLPIRDIYLAPPYQTNARTSPPTFSTRACLSVMMPLGVDMIAIPMPFITLGISLQLV